MDSFCQIDKDDDDGDDDGYIKKYVDRQLVQADQLYIYILHILYYIILYKYITHIEVDISSMSVD